MLDYVEVEQNTDEWLALRAGRLTSSKLGVVMAHYPKPFGEPAKAYAIDIAIEQITGKPIPGGFRNAHMDRGHEEEPLARMAYEDEMFCDVKNGGFYCNDFIGCSPDFNVDDDGLGEIKCVIPSVHYKRIKKGGIDTAYKWQCVGNMMFTGRDWLDFVSYCASYPDDKKLFIHRISKSDHVDDYKSIINRIDEFKKLVDESKKQIEAS